MKIHVQNFQSIEHASLDAEGLTVIVGPSDRGKSALLRAISAALFNRPGDQFVRVGATSAAVALDFGGHRIEWVKGGGQNRFTVDDADYSKVGAKAPQALQALGFKDVLIGARVRDDGKVEGGELLRPQVARQLQDPIFLLDESGPFLNEALVQVSRLGVLQRANRLCSSDLRSQKGLLKVRQADFAAAETAEAALRPIVEVRTRVQGLETRAAFAAKIRAQVIQLRALVTERTRLRQVLVYELPEKTDYPKVQATVQRLVTLRQLVETRARVQQVAQLPFPKERRIKKTVVTQMGKWSALSPLVYALAAQQLTVKQLTRSHELLERAHEGRVELIEALKAELKVCPTCDRPF